MRIELGAPVDCRDGEGGDVADVVIDPRTRTVTHLVVAPHHRHSLARLVPIDDIDPDPDWHRLTLRCSVAELRRYPFVEEQAFVRLSEPIDLEEGWDVGIEHVLALPYMSAECDSTGANDGAVIAFDRIPKDEVEIRRSSNVTSSDGHHLGDVDGFVLDDEDHVTHVVLQHGHLWGKRDVAIPIGLVARTRNDNVLLSVTRQDVGRLPEIRVRRPR